MLIAFLPAKLVWISELRVSQGADWRPNGGSLVSLFPMDLVLDAVWRRFGVSMGALWCHPTSKFQAKFIVAALWRYSGVSLGALWCLIIKYVFVEFAMAFCDP